MMKDEPTLFNQRIEDIPLDRIQEHFERYHKAHPEVFQLFLQYATQAMIRGMEKFSARAIIHRIRWFHAIEKGNTSFKINDHFSSRYARLLMKKDDRYKDFFELRELKGGD